MKLGLGLGFGLVVTALTGCPAPAVDRVYIAPLPPDPTPEQRVWLFNAVRPAAKVTESETTCRYRGSCVTTVTNGIQLPDGRIVRDPEDLAPLVAPDSPTLAHAHHATRAAGHLRWWGAGLVTALVGGFLLAVNGHGNDNDIEMEIGLGVAVGGLLVGSTGAYIERDNISADRRAAFATYPHDLAARLSLCASGEVVVPCEQNTPTTVAPQAPDPNLDQLRQR